MSHDWTNLLNILEVKTRPYQKRSGLDVSPLLIAGSAIGALIIGRAFINRLHRADLHGKAVLITGSTRGLGYLLAKEFARQGCRIALCGRDPDEVSVVQAELMEEGIEVFALVCDVSDKAQVDHMIAEITFHYGAIDILVNNAGVIQVGPVETATVEDFHNAIDTIFFGHVNCILAVLPQMRQRHRGRIVNITSIGGKVSFPHLLPYNSAKFAAVGFSEGLRAELANQGITVTTIIPGLMRTGAHLNTMIKGRVAEEFTWFSISDSLPFISIDAARAARQIVEATRRGDSEYIITLPAVMLDMAHRLFPKLMIEVMGIVNRFLPSPEGGTHQPTWSMDVYRQIETPALDTALTMSTNAALDNHEVPGPVNTIGVEESYDPDEVRG